MIKNSSTNLYILSFNVEVPVMAGLLSKTIIKEFGLEISGVEV
jgi:hypothetical protein